MTPCPRSPSSSVFRASGHDTADIVPSKAIPMEGVTTVTTVDSPDPKKPGKSYRSHDDGPSMTNESRDTKEQSAGNTQDTERLRQSEWRLIHDGGNRVEEALLPPKKRATSDASGHSRHSDDSFAPPKTRRIGYVDTGSKDGGTSETPVPHHRVDASGTTSTVASTNPAEEDDLSKTEKRSLLKGKMIATEESGSMAIAPVTSEPPQKKLMHDGIRSGVRFDEYFIQVPRSERSSCDGASWSTSAGRPVDACSGVPPARGSPFDKVRTSMELRDRLEELGATDPEYVCEKTLKMSDVCRNQNRLLVSCKRNEITSCSLTCLFTTKEMRLVEDKSKGLEVTVFDHRGDKYAMKCKYLDSNGGYRFINQWGEFLDHNSLNLHGIRGREWTRHVDVELWAFRSWRLPKLPDGEETGHPDGALGLILLHYEGRRRNVEGGEQKWKRALPIHHTKTKQMGEESASAPTPAPVVKEEKKRALPVHQTKTKHMGEESAPAPMVKEEKRALLVHQTKTKHMREELASAPAPVVKEEKKLADAVEEQREAGTSGMMREDMAAMVEIGKDMLDAVIGILKLTSLFKP